ncbi:outer membrane beta-barrel protein, partial [Methylobacterium sp. GXS13]|uniref:outer membrane beta-barrel protein n=1 Tax=Methylobacterium sp. GXS13 TaxID=1730094 RepID=UPI001FCDB8F4
MRIPASSASTVRVCTPEARVAEAAARCSRRVGPAGGTEVSGRDSTGLPVWVFAAGLVAGRGGALRGGGASSRATRSGRGFGFAPPAAAADAPVGTAGLLGSGGPRTPVRFTAATGVTETTILGSSGILTEVATVELQHDLLRNLSIVFG